MNAVAAVSRPMRTDIPSISPRTEDLRETRVLLFCGETITDAEKYRSPDLYGPGGIFLPHVHTLRPASPKGMLYRCLLTPLMPKMVGENIGMMMPAEAKTMPRSFTQQNSKYDEATDTWKSEHIGFTQNVEGMSKSSMEFKTNATRSILGYREVLPGEEILRAVERNEPNGIGGVIEVKALRGSTAEERMVAQLFFFPNWHAIEQREATLPSDMETLRAHIHDRLKLVDTMPNPAQLLAIGEAYLASCTEFAFAGENTVQYMEDALLEAKDKKVYGLKFPAQGNLLLSTLKLRRKADVIAGDSSAVNTLANVVLQEREDKAANDTRMLALEERKQYTAEVTAGLRERDLEEEIRLGMRKPEPMTSGYVETLPRQPQPEAVMTTTHSEHTVFIDPNPTGRLDDTVDVSTRICGQPTKAGTPCDRTLKESETSCFQHGS